MRVSNFNLFKSEALLFLLFPSSKFSFFNKSLRKIRNELFVWHFIIQTNNFIKRIDNLNTFLWDRSFKENFSWFSQNKKEGRSQFNINYNFLPLIEIFKQWKLLIFISNKSPSIDFILICDCNWHWSWRWDKLDLLINEKWNNFRSKDWFIRWKSINLSVVVVSKCIDITLISLSFIRWS